jgi:hypothetical protein
MGMIDGVMRDVRYGFRTLRRDSGLTVFAVLIRPGRIDGVSRNAFRPILTPLQERVSGRARQALLVVAGAAGFLMLLVCANLSNLLLTRGTARQKDMALRTALGAERHRLIRQVLVESVMPGWRGTFRPAERRGSIQ